MADAKTVVDDKAVPAVSAVYHFRAVPVATKLATVAELQNACAVAVGAAVAFIVTATVVLALSTELIVCDT